ncbi:Pentatricopeptide repeat-containing protein, chloroplastic isoform C [Glycine soja]|uniref:Pentatricopeptide repeat-containing protein, chloroplastic isoform C n=1 Tax=Glycine soja TaxID=3848 RepID=A0A445J6G6_GLYSO|nr:Pentatricopeptide repeat-containing protein, chloroplastic isoform C [Glycine soja]
MLNPTTLFPSLPFLLLFTRFYSHSPRKPLPKPLSFDDAVSSFHSMLHLHPPPSIVSLNKLLSSIMKTKHFSTVVSLCSHLDSKGTPKPSLVTLSIFINSFTHLGQMGLAFSVMGKIIKRGFGVDPFTLTTLMNGLCLKGRTFEALNLYDHAVSKGFSFDEVGRFQGAVRLLNEMVIKEDVRPDVYTFNILVDAMCKLGMVAEARNVFGLMIKRGLEPDVVSYNALMNGWCLRGCVSEAKEVLDRMVERGKSPNVISYSTLINGYCKVKMVDEAMRLLTEMHQRNLVPDTVTYYCLLDGLSKSGRVLYEWDLVEAMRASGQAPDLITYNVLLDDYLKCECLDKALVLFQHIVDMGISPNIRTYNILIDGLCKGGRLKAAKEIFQLLSVKGCHPNIRTYNIMINGLRREGLLDEADALLLEMVDNGFPPNAVTFDPLTIRFKWYVFAVIPRSKGTLHISLDCINQEFEFLQHFDIQAIETSSLHCPQS